MSEPVEPSVESVVEMAAPAVVAPPKIAPSRIPSATSTSALPTISSAAKVSGIKHPATRIGRPCCQSGDDGMHTPKAGPPPLEVKSKLFSARTLINNNQSDKNQIVCK